MPTPATPSDATSLLDRTQHVLRVHDSRSMAGSLGRFVFGILWCLGAGAIFASLVCMLLWTIGVGSLIGWFGWLGIYALIVVGLIWQSGRNSREDLLDAVRDLDPNPSSRGEYEMNNARVQIAVIG